MASTTSTAASSSQSTIAENVITSMNRSLGELQNTLGTLNDETVESIRRGGEQYIDGELSRIRRKMDASDAQQKAEAHEINALVKQILEEELVKQLAELINAGVLEEIDDLVKEQVSAQLPYYLQPAQQDEVQRHKDELEALELQLKNAESVRHNAELPRDPDLKLSPLYTARGAVSDSFPVTLGDLFNMPEKTAVGLLHEYGQPEVIVADSREKNVNAFMRLCGVSRYLLDSVDGGPPVPRSPTTGATPGGGRR